MRDAHDQIKQHTWPMGVGVQNEFNWLSLLKKTLNRSLTHISPKDCECHPLGEPTVVVSPFLRGVQILFVRDELCTADNEQKMMRRKY